jgi:hypothetical protein
MGGVEGFIVMVNEGSEEKIELLLKSLQPFILGVTIQSCNDHMIANRPTITDYYIMKTISRQSKDGDIGDGKKYFNISKNCT